MNLLTKELIKDLLPENQNSTIAIYGGGFKFPQSGHFEVVKKALKNNPNINEFIILIGNKERDGITQSNSFDVWNIYKKYLSPKIKIIKSNNPPIKEIYSYTKNNPDKNIIYVIGARENNEEDIKDIELRIKYINKYPNLKPEIIINQNNISGTNARKALKISFDEFKKFLPTEITYKESQEIYNILKPNIKENKSIIKENIKINSEKYLYYIKKCFNECCKELNIPKPKLQIINNDSYTKQHNSYGGYIPSENKIILVIYGRDCMSSIRSLSHECKHAEQNYNNQLNSNSGDDGSNEENDANIYSGKTCRWFGRKYPEAFFLRYN